VIKLHGDTYKIAARPALDRCHFTFLKIDTRTRQAKLALLALEAFLEDCGGPSGLSVSERLSLEDAALEVARARIMEERFTKGEAFASDVCGCAPCPQGQNGGGAHSAPQGREEEIQMSNVTDFGLVRGQKNWAQAQADMEVFREWIDEVDREGEFFVSGEVLEVIRRWGTELLAAERQVTE
jgi:hypothetical protein